MIGLILAATMLAAGPAPADPASVSDAPMPKAEPLANLMARFYPSVAERYGLEGRAILQCIQLDSGRFRGCEVVEETPAGVGFGRAAVQIGHRLALPQREGERLAEGGRRVRLPIVFRTSDERPIGKLTFEEALACYAQFASDAAIAASGLSDDAVYARLGAERTAVIRGLGAGMGIADVRERLTSAGGAPDPALARRCVEKLP